MPRRSGTFAKSSDATDLRTTQSPPRNHRQFWTSWLSRRTMHVQPSSDNGDHHMASYRNWEVGVPTWQMTVWFAGKRHVKDMLVDFTMLNRFVAIGNYGPLKQSLLAVRRGTQITFKSASIHKCFENWSHKNRKETVVS